MRTGIISEIFDSSVSQLQSESEVACFVLIGTRTSLQPSGFPTYRSESPDLYLASVLE